MRRVLLDTHVVIWLATDVPALGLRSVARVEEAISAQEAFVSAIAFWEITLLVQRGRLTLPSNVLAWREAVLGFGLTELPLTGIIGVEAAFLGDLYADPADRMTVATALHHGLTLVTADRKIIVWPGDIDRHDARR